MNRFTCLHALALSLLTLATPPLLTSCTQAERQETAADTQETYTDFKNYVEGVERDADRTDFSDTEFSTAMNRMKADYDAKVAAVDRDIDHYSAEQRAEVESLKTRYAAAVERRESAYRARSTGSTTTTTTTTTSSASPAGSAHYQSVGASYATLPASELRPTYERFVQQAKANQNRYDAADWQVVNADWQALNARRDQVSRQLSDDDQAEIAQEKAKYAALKTFSRASVAKGARAVGETAKDMGRIIEKGAEKVGTAAKGADNGAREAVRKDEAEREARRQ